MASRAGAPVRHAATHSAPHPWQVCTHRGRISHAPARRHAKPSDRYKTVAPAQHTGDPDRRSRSTGTKSPRPTRQGRSRSRERRQRWPSRTAPRPGYAAIHKRSGPRPSVNPAKAPTIPTPCCRHRTHRRKSVCAIASQPKTTCRHDHIPRAWPPSHAMGCRGP